MRRLRPRFSAWFHDPRNWLAVLMAVGLPASAVAQRRAASPASKIYVSDVSGLARIDTGEKIHELSRRAVYNAEGTVIETDASDSGAGRRKPYSTMVYSNGTGAFFDADTRVELKRFMQEAFTPTRTDFDVEPSISHTHAYVSRGAVGLCTSKLVAGSSMVYHTPHAAVTILGRKLVIEVDTDETRISMIEGEGTVRAGALDTGSHTLRAGEQALVRRGTVGQPNAVEIRRIPAGEVPVLDEKVALACMAKRTVYFEVRERSADSGETNSELPSAAEAPPAEALAIAAGAAAPGNNSPGVVRAFYGNTAAAGIAPAREIVAIPVVPANLPVPFVVSPANLAAPGR